MFVSHIVPDLQKPVDGSVHPIIKVDAIKYLEIFRGQVRVNSVYLNTFWRLSNGCYAWIQLTKEQLLEIIPSLSSHLASKNCAVQTYAAYCLERVFAMKTGPQFIFQSSDILPMASSIVGRLFDLIEADPRPAKLAENDYLMKGMKRIISTLVLVL